MKKLLTLLGLCIFLAMQSCSSEQEPDAPNVNETDSSMSHIVVKFEDQVYETDVMTVGDSVVYLNEEYDKIYREKIANAKDLAAITSVNESGIMCVEYFPSEKDLLASYDFVQLESTTEELPGKSTRSKVIDLMVPNNGVPIIAKAELYDDRNFKDTKLIAYAATTWATAIDRLARYGFNDKTSSIKVYNEMDPTAYYEIGYWDYDRIDAWQERVHRGDGLRPVLVCHHNSDFSGTVIYCIAPPTGSKLPFVSSDKEVHTDNNLKTIGWNDRISSIDWCIVYDFSVFTGENPKIPAHPDC